MSNKKILLKLDENGNPIPVGGSILTSHGLVNSPLQKTDDSITTLEIPDNCAEIIMVSNQDFQYSEVSTLSTHSLVPSGVIFTLGVSDTEQLFLKRNTSNETNIYITFVIN